jgi:hypothetical protein
VCFDPTRVGLGRSGKLDIVGLAGNNLELRGRPITTQHGVRVLHNDGNWLFHEVLFEPRNILTIIGVGRVSPLRAAESNPERRARSDAPYLQMGQRRELMG